MTQGAPQDSRPRRSLRRTLGSGLLIAIAYIVAADVGFRVAFLAEQITTVWAPTGIALAALLRGGLRLWPAVWVGAFIANAGTEAPVWTAPAIATGNTLEAVAAAWILRRRLPRFDTGFRHVTDVAAFVALAAGVCTTISATVGVATLCAASVQPWDRFGLLWFEWWFGDALGAALVAPAILAAIGERWSRRLAVHAGLFVVGAMLVTYFVFGQLFGSGAHPLGFVVFPVVILAAVAVGPSVSSLTVLGASAVAIWATVSGTGPFAGPDVHRSLLLLQVFMGVLGVTGLLLAAAMAERQQVERGARETATALGDREEMLRLAQRAGGVATFEWDFGRQVARCSAEFFRMLGLPARDGEIAGAEWAQFVHPDDRDRMAAHLARALEGLEPAAADYRIVAADGSVRYLSYAGQIQRTAAGERMLGTVLDITDRKRLEAELRHHAVEVERILESIGEGFVALDRELRFVYVNQAAEQMLGHSRADLIGRSPWEVFSPEMVAESRQQLEAALSDGAARRYDAHVPEWNRWYENRVYPSETGLSVFFADVTARMGAEAALRESRDVLSLAMRGGSMGAWSRNLVTNEVWWSRELEEIFGLTPGAFARTEAGFFEFVHPDDREAVRQAVEGALANRTDYLVEFRFRRADSSEWRWMEGRGRAVYAADGTPRILYGLGIDVTARKRTEVALQQAKIAAEQGQLELEQANRELRRRVVEQQTLLDVLPLGIGIATDRECRTIRTNRSFAKTLGLPPDRNASKTAAAEERPTNFRVLATDGSEVPDQDLPIQIAAREGREVRDLELDVVHDDGRVVRLLGYAAPLVDEQGGPRGAVGAFVDVTALHHARATLGRSEERYRRIFDTAGVSLWEEDFSAVKAALDRIGAHRDVDLEAYLRASPAFVDECIRLVKIVDVNAATLRMFGAADKQELLESLERIFGPESREAFIGELIAFVRGERRYEGEATLRTIDARPLHVLISIAFPAPGQGLDSVLVSLADITDRRLAETALRQEIEVRTTLSQVGASLARELRSDSLAQAVMDAATQLTEAELGAFVYGVPDVRGGTSPKYALAGVPRGAFSIPPDGRAMAVFGPASGAGVESVIRMDDVTQDPRVVQGPPFSGMPGLVRSYLAVPVVGRGGIVLGGLFFGHSQVGMFSPRHALLAAGVAGWAAIALDNARLYQDAEEANRLKDEFLATLSHELRTPLNAVLGWARMLRQGAIQPPMQQRALESIERNAAVQAQLVDDLLDVSRIMTGKLQIGAAPVDLGAVIVNAVETVQAGVTAKGLTLNVHLPTDRRIIVTGDADRLQQVVWNLVSNAIKFTPVGGRIDVALQQMHSSAEIVVRDTGQGIDPAFWPHLFQRFRQVDASKARIHGGLGLGLSIVRHLVEAHGGQVSAESAGAGQGATFSVLLPLRAVEEISADTFAAAAPPLLDGALQGVRVAVIDDHADARALMRYALESSGAAVATAASAGEALHLLAQDRFDILVADIGMPEQDGLALIRLLRSLPDGSLNRDIPAIAVTAHTAVRDREAALSAGFACQLGKPVDPQLLVSTVVGLVNPEVTR